jgi:NO-binding membrane sensor protein with MHYT domain
MSEVRLREENREQDWMLTSALAKGDGIFCSSFLAILTGANRASVVEGFLFAIACPQKKKKEDIHQ